MCAVRAQILDCKAERQSCCYLVKITLSDYIDSLPGEYRSYDVQRGVVSNVYLDRLVDTVLAKEHIPPIVLIADKAQCEINEDQLNIREFKILDGLQRTARLDVINQTINLSQSLNDEVDDLLSLSRYAFSRKFSGPMSDIGSNTTLLRIILQAYKDVGADRLKDCLRKNDQWFEVWVGLTPEQEIQKMLTLNAGHKPVTTRHQLELLFLNLLPFLRTETGTQIRVTREKEVSSTQFSKGRSVGSFHFAHLITAILSLAKKKPVAATTTLVQSIQDSDDVLYECAEYLSPVFLSSLARFLVALDEVLAQHYGTIGIAWMGREVTLSGILGAVGAVASSSGSPASKLLDEFQARVVANPSVLNLEQFESLRNNLDLSKVNIGNANRSAVFEGVKPLIEHGFSSHSINWSEFFHRGLE